MYIQQAPDFLDPEYPRFVYRLEKGLYGLGHAEKVQVILILKELQQGVGDRCLFRGGRDECCTYVVSFANDLVMTNGSEQ